MNRQNPRLLRKMAKTNSTATALAEGSTKRVTMSREESPSMNNLSNRLKKLSKISRPKKQFGASSTQNRHGPMEVLRHFIQDTYRQSTQENEQKPNGQPDVRQVTPSLIEAVQEQEIAAFEVSADPLGVVKKHPQASAAEGVPDKGRIVMLIASRGNDIRAKKEAKTLASAGYEIVFVGREDSLDTAREMMDDEFKLIQVPTVKDAGSLLSIVRRNRKHLTPKEIIKALLLAAFFSVTQFRIVARPGRNNLTPLDIITKAHLYGARRLKGLAQRVRIKGLKTGSSTLLILQSFLLLCAGILSNIYRIIFLPVFLIYWVFKTLFGAWDTSMRNLNSVAADASMRLGRHPTAWQGARFVAIVTVAKLARGFTKVFKTLPSKAFAKGWRLLTWPYRRVKNKILNSLRLRARLVYTLNSYFFYAIEARTEVKALKPLAVHSHDLYMLQAAVTAAKPIGAKTVYDAHELETDRHATTHPRMRSLIAREEKIYASQAHGCITVSEGIAEIMDQHIGRDDTIVVFNSPFLSNEPEFPEAHIRADLGLSDDVGLALYVGKLSGIHQHDQRIENMIEAFAYLPNMHLAVLGAVTPRCKQEIDQWAKRFFISDRVSIIDPVPYVYLVDYIASADVGINPLETKCISNEHSMPNKLFEFTLSGVPMAQADTKDSMDYLTRYQMGLAMDPMNARDIASVVDELYEQRETYTPSSERLAVMRSLYSMPAQGDKLAALYDRILNEA